MWGVGPKDRTKEVRESKATKEALGCGKSSVQVLIRECWLMLVKPNPISDAGYIGENTVSDQM